MSTSDAIDAWLVSRPVVDILFLALPIFGMAIGILIGRTIWRKR